MFKIPTLHDIGNNKREIFRGDYLLRVAKTNDALQHFRLILFAQTNTQFIEIIDQRGLAAHLAQRVNALAPEALGTQFGDVEIAF